MKNCMRTIVLLLAPILGGAQADDCARCHAAQSKAHAPTSMARALERVDDCQILRANPRLAFEAAGYKYTITREGNRSTYTVTNGRETFTTPIEWAFGLGAAGQTYVFERSGLRYESRVSFFKSINGLDLTLGVPHNATPRDLIEAAGREMTKRDTASCFGCHSLNGVRGTELTLETLRPGVLCGNCHTGAEIHSAAVRKGDVKAARLPQLKRATAEEISDLCGKCHRTWADIASNGPRGLGNVRFQPYRLANSRCYDASDARIGCTACHDPHAEAERSAAAYDPKCAACHSTNAKAKAPTCRAGNTKGCATCHMPKYEIPGSHHQFSDHQIRIVRNNEPYPN